MKKRYHAVLLAIFLLTSCYSWDEEDYLEVNRRDLLSLYFTEDTLVADGVSEIIIAASIPNDGRGYDSVAFTTELGHFKENKQKTLNKIANQSSIARNDVTFPPDQDPGKISAFVHLVAGTKTGNNLIYVSTKYNSSGRFIYFKPSYPDSIYFEVDKFMLMNDAVDKITVAGKLIRKGKRKVSEDIPVQMVVQDSVGNIISDRNYFTDHKLISNDSAAFSAKLAIKTSYTGEAQILAFVLVGEDTVAKNIRRIEVIAPEEE